MQSGSRLLLAFLVLLTIFVWLAALSFPDKNLHIISCSVGQGDATLITYGTVQVLVDGGPNDSVLGCMNRHMPFWDRTVEVVIMTHPEADHITGLVAVVERYKLGHFVATSVINDTEEYRALERAIAKSGTSVISATDRRDLLLGPLMVDTNHPTQAYLNYETSAETNNYSIVTQVNFGEFDALLTGDIGPDVIDEVLRTGEVRDVDYLKVPHHGSKNGLTSELLEAAAPELAVISVGKNQWGHPHKEILDMLANRGVTVKRTDTDGEVDVVTDGVNWWIED